MTGSVAERVGRASLLTACVQAANVWSAPNGTTGERWQRVAELHGGVALAHLVHEGRLLPLTEFAAGLSGQLVDLIPANLREEWDDIPLLEGDDLSGPATDLLRENLAPSATALQVAEWGWQSLSAEKVQGWLYHQLLDSGTDEGYVQARLAVIQHPAGEMVTVNNRIKAVGLPRDGLYESIPAWAWVTRGADRYWFQCPLCRWPMRVQLGTVSCRYPPHQRQIGSLTVRLQGDGSPRLSGLRADRIGKAGAETDTRPLPVQGHISLVHPVWRYSTIPGWEEWGLARVLREIKGVDAQLWPRSDAYDLLVTVVGTNWRRRIDLKDYSDPGRLANLLSQKQALRDKDMLILVPDYRESQVGVLNERLQSAFGGTRKRYASTAKDFVRQVTTVAAKSGGTR